jgi:hypothetical protein
MNYDSYNYDGIQKVDDSICEDPCRIERSGDGEL